ncbi:MAG: hypothetical protein ACRCWJ_07500 [Casimicrobium sp.]
MAFAANSFATPGQPGTLDATWGALSPSGAGKVITSLENGTDSANAIAVQPDGKVLVAGFCRSSTNFDPPLQPGDICAVRYNANGTLDTTWNDTGKVITPGNARDTDAAQAIALQPDGKVLLAGYCGLSFCALRYNNNGTLDTTWNDTGVVITPIGIRDRANAIALQPDGKVLLAGYCLNGTNPAGGSNTNFCTVRYNVNGTLDTAWNGTGTLIAVTTDYQEANAMALQPDGKVLLAGSCVGATNSGFCALRYNTDGTLDTSWNGTGTVTTPIGEEGAGNRAYAIALQPDGKVVLAGQCYSNFATASAFCALRYNADGTLDTSWNGTGTVITPINGDGNNAFGYAIALQPDGKVLLSGGCGQGTNSRFCALRYNANGTVDTSWNGTGSVITAVGQAGGAWAIALQPDGKVLLAGGCLNGVGPGGFGANTDFCIARYDGGPFAYKACSLDIDGDNRTVATIDGLISTRVMLGMTDASVINGIDFAPHATRTTWPAIREYLITQCGMQLL